MHNSAFIFSRGSFCVIICFLIHGSVGQRLPELKDTILSKTEERSLLDYALENTSFVKLRNSLAALPVEIRYVGSTDHNSTSSLSTDGVINIIKRVSFWGKFHFFWT